MTFADINKANEIISEVYPGARDISYITHGYDNLVALIDEEYAVRFPQTDGAYARSNLETHVLNSLELITTVNIPKVLGVYKDPPYSITSFIPGAHLKAVQVDKLALANQHNLALKIAEFAHSMHTSLSVEDVLLLRDEFSLDNQIEETWDTYLEKMLYDRQLPTELQDEIAKSYYDAWANLAYSTPLLVLHDDLHTQNMMFEDDELTGVLDFGDTNVGHPEQELRQLYRINEFVVDVAATRYEELSGYKLNREAIKLWAIVQELGVYMEHISKKDTAHPAFHRATRNLEKWIGRGSWNSSEQLSKLDYDMQ